jgi:phage FluMu protein Com
MAVAAVLPFPTDRSKNIGDLQTQMVEVGIEAVKTVVENLMDKFKGKDFQAISEMLKEQGQQVTGAMFSKLLNAVANDGETTARCPQCKGICGIHSKSGRTIESLHGELKIDRPYFYCNSCSIGFAPFDVKMKLLPLN